MMSPKEYAELLDYINDKHSWANLYTNTVDNNRKVVKYVESSCDTRDGKIWVVKVSFSDIVNSPLPNDNNPNFKAICFEEERCTVENIKNWLNNYEKEKGVNNDC